MQLIGPRDKALSPLCKYALPGGSPDGSQVCMYVYMYVCMCKLCIYVARYVCMNECIYELCIYVYM